MLMTIFLHSFLVTHISLIKLVLHTTAFSKSNVTFEKDNTMLLDEAKLGSRKMFALHACTKLLENHHSNSVFWQLWTATILSSLSTVHSVQDQSELTNM